MCRRIVGEVVFGVSGEHGRWLIAGRPCVPKLLPLYADRLRGCVGEGDRKVGVGGSGRRADDRRAQGQVVGGGVEGVQDAASACESDPQRELAEDGVGLDKQRSPR